MDFGTLPPEINSGRLYSGPGPASLLAAATAWDGLASELGFSASGYSSVIANLTSAGWQGPSSVVMAGAVAPYVAWLHDTAAQATQTAAAARASGGAYEAALAAVVPPPLIEANRAQLVSLVATNFFGQNSPAIAATEAAYHEMWAQDAAVMYGYADSAASASRLTPFAQPPQTTQPGGQAAQAAAAAQGAVGSPQLTSGLTTALQGLASPAAASSAASSSGIVPVIAGVPASSYALFGAVSSQGVFDEVWRLISLGSRITGFQTAALRDFAQGIGPFDPFFGIPLPETAPAASATSAASAIMGRASVVGTLSVPPSWAATTAPAVDTAVDTGEVMSSDTSAAAEDFAGMPGSMMFGETLLGTLAGRAISATAAKSRPNKANKVVPRSPAGG